MAKTLRDLKTPKGLEKTSAPKAHRKFLRYNVSLFSKLEARLAGHLDHARVMSLGAGGCSFVSPINEQAASSNSIVCTFHIENITEEPLAIRGRIVYRHDTSSDASNIHRYGIEFDAASRSRLKAILDYLELMAEVGAVYTC